MSYRTTTLAGAAALGLLLAGCGGDTEPIAAPETSETTSEPAVTAASLSPTTTTAGVAGSPGSFTKPGSKLEIGQKAVVPNESGNTSGSVGITPTKITKADPADLAPLNLGDKASGLTPYYITFVVTNESGHDLSFTGLSSVDGLLADGSRSGGVSIIGDFAPCDEATAPSEFNTKGATYTTCEVALAGPGASVTGVSFSGTNSDKIPGTDYSGAPLTWK